MVGDKGWLSNLSKGLSNEMATRLDQQIEQLENMVERRLDLCKVTRNGHRCTLPANHPPAHPHQFPVDFSSVAKPAAGNQGSKRRSPGRVGLDSSYDVKSANRCRILVNTFA